jgi:uncharacterized phage protein gp47/JayE
MPQLPVKTFDQLVQDQQAALQASNPNFTDLTAGSPLLALIEANAGMGLFMQYLVWVTLLNTRMQTSQGTDLDSFGAQFLFGRYPAVSATGIVLFTRYTSLNSATVPVFSLLRSTDGSLTFQVIADPTNYYFSSQVNAYVVPAGVNNFTALVQCTIPGAIGNIQPNTLTRIASTIVGVSVVSNPSVFINGVDNESDASYRTRFQSYINSLSRGTLLAISNAILNTQPGLTFTVQENIAADGTDLPGNLLIYYDDGTGSPPAGLTLLLQQNVNAVRAAGVSFSLAPAFTVVVSIFFSTTFAAGYNKNTQVASLAIAIEAYINSIPVGQNIIYTKLYQIIYENGTGLVEAYNLQINGVAADLVIQLNQVARFIPATRAGGPGSTMTID